jgi:hypothetical protein
MRTYEMGSGLAVGRQLHRDNSFISSAGVLRDKQGIEQALTSVGFRWFFQTLLQGTAPAEQIKGISTSYLFFTLSKGFFIMAYAYAITQYNGLDYQNGFQPKWNLVSERNDQKQALRVCEVLNNRTKYTHRVEVMKSVDLPKFSILKVAKNENQHIVIPASFKVIKKRSFLRRLLGAFF